MASSVVTVKSMSMASLRAGAKLPTRRSAPCSCNPYGQSLWTVPMDSPYCSRSEPPLPGTAFGAPVFPGLPKSSVPPGKNNALTLTPVARLAVLRGGTSLHRRLLIARRPSTISSRPNPPGPCNSVGQEQLSIGSGSRPRETELCLSRDLIRSCSPPPCRRPPRRPAAAPPPPPRLERPHHAAAGCRSPSRRRSTKSASTTMASFVVSRSATTASSAEAAGA